MAQRFGRTSTGAFAAAAIALTLSTPNLAQAAGQKFGPELVPNGSFETSTADAATRNGIPVLPTGWSFEGSTVLFDYNQRGAHSGLRAVSISGSLGGGRQVCDQSSGTQQCASNPAYAQTHGLDDATVGTTSVRPVWRTAAALVAVPGQRYRFAAWTILPSFDPNAGVLGEGAATRVRWLDSAGHPVSVVDGGSYLKTKKRVLGFTLVSADLTAPAGAVGAVLLLGHSDYSHTGAQVCFDDVSFRQLLK